MVAQVGDMAAGREALAHLLEEVALQAGARILELRQSREDIAMKEDGSPVTEADRQAEAMILAALRQHAAEVAVVSEENKASHRQAAAQRFFLVDPLDGTREFVRENSKGAFTVNIGLIEDGVPVVGVVYAPALGRLFCGVAGVGAWEGVGAQRHGIAARQASGDGLVAVASRSHGDDKTRSWMARHNVREERLLGSSLKFCLVACGEADVYPRFGPTMEWDTAAGDAILRAAGGRVLDLEGTPLGYGKAGYRNEGFVAWASRGADKA